MPNEEYTENWREHKAYLKKEKANRKEDDGVRVSEGYEESYFDELKPEFTVRRLTPYQFRITANGQSVDLFPKSRKYHHINKNERGGYGYIYGEELKRFITDLLK